MKLDNINWYLVLCLVCCGYLIFVAYDRPTDEISCEYSEASIREQIIDSIGNLDSIAWEEIK